MCVAPKHRSPCRRRLGRGELLGEGAVWVATIGIAETQPGGRAAVSKIDPTTNELVQTIELPAPAQELSIAADGEALWVTGGDAVWRVDPSSASVAEIARHEGVEAGPFFTGIAVGKDAVWAALPGLDGVVSRIDPAVGEVVATIEFCEISVGEFPCPIDDVAVGEEGVWVAVER